MKTWMKFEGGEDLEAALMDMKAGTAKGVVRRVLKKVLEPVAEDMRQGAPGSLARKIVITSKADPSQRAVDKAFSQGSRNFVPMSAGPDLKQEAGHAHLVEFGTGQRKQAKSERSTGAMPERPFIRPAWDKAEGSLVPEMARLMGLEIQKAIARATRKAARDAAKAGRK